MAMFSFCFYKVFLIIINCSLDKEAKRGKQSLFLILIVLKATLGRN